MTIDIAKANEIRKKCQRLSKKKIDAGFVQLAKKVTKLTIIGVLSTIISAIFVYLFGMNTVCV